MALVHISQPEKGEVIRVFPDRTKWTPDDHLAFVGLPPFREMLPGNPPHTPVYVSVTFTWHRAMAERIAAAWREYYSDVRIGGPAYDDPGGEFVPGRFLKLGCTITSRGCPKKCGWCKVPFSEGKLRYLSINPGWIVQDNNLLACKRDHAEGVFAMLREQKRRVFFNGGLDKHYLQPWHRELLASVPVGELWFACDTSKEDELVWLQRVRELLPDYPPRKMRCYTMIGYDDQSLAQAERRIESVYELGFFPFSQLYQPPTADQPSKIYDAEWKRVNRKWSRPAAYAGKAAPPEPNLFENVTGEPSVNRGGGECN